MTAKPDDNAARQKPEPDDKTKRPADPARPREIGGRKGPDPTRYGDWEIGGRCIDF
jgi:hypothetical protein